MSTAKIPPNDLEAEQSVLSAMLYDPEAVGIVADILKPEDFYRPDNAAIYNAMIILHGGKIPVDAVMLKNELTKQELFEKVGGSSYITELLYGYSTSANVKYHALEVKRHSESRQILKSLTDLIQKPESVSVRDLKNVLVTAEGNQYIKSYSEKSMQGIDAFKQNIRIKKHRALTGFKVLDTITGGFRIPSVVMIGAYPSVGKTAFALNIAANQENPVVFFSLEMSGEMIYERLAAAKLKIDYNLFTSQQLTENHFSDIETFSDDLKKRQFHVFDDVYFIEQQTTIIANIKPRLVVVDYIQKVKTHRKTDIRRNEIDYISGMYKQIAKNNNCVIVILSQLSRDRDKAKPTMSNLKESGSLEADGDYIGILHRPYVMQKDKPQDVRPEDGYILIDKNKFGNTGQINLYFNGRYQQFYEVDKQKPVDSDKPAKNNDFTQCSMFGKPEPVEDDELPFE